jgi:hypothetical protein
MITARIAEDDLKVRAPQVFAKANDILSALSNPYEDNHPFVESATFPDKFKWHGYKQLGRESPINTHGYWHYVNTPFYNGYKPEDVVIDPKNVVFAITTLKALMNNAKVDELSSYQLRCLIHYVGDIHQPLHATTMYSPEFKKGDRGGNSFKLARHGQIDELHALWDSVVTEYEDDWKQPLNADGWTSVG